MYTQSCNYMPNKKQSPLGLTGSMPQHLGLIKKIPYFNYGGDSSEDMSVDFKTISEDHHSHNDLEPSTNMGMMDFMYSFGDTSKSKTTVSTIPSHSERPKNNCKDISMITQYSGIATIPMLPSHIGVGFVGSESQIGRTSTHDFRPKLWDIVRDLVGIVGHPPNCGSSENIQKTSVIEENNCDLVGHPPNFGSSENIKNTSVIEENNCDLVGHPPNSGSSENIQKNSVIEENNCDLVGHPPNFGSSENIQITSVIEENNCDLLEAEEKQYSSTSISNNCIVKHQPSNFPKNMEQSTKQSYADVAKAKSCKINQTPFKSTQSDQPVDNYPSSCHIIDSSSPKHEFEHQLLASGNNSRRNRFPSECSADSEDSFIVFEYCADDLSEDSDSSCSDDESIPDSHSNEESASESGSGPSRKFSFNHNCGSGAKKVRFAEGKKLAQIHPMVTWNFAYRSARKGPWETLALDSQRFKCRVAKTEKILAPVLDPTHRAAVYQLRFSPSLDSLSSS